MGGVQLGIGSFVSGGEAASGAALVLAGAAGWVLSLVAGWATPAPFVDSLGRIAITASGFSMLLLLAGLAVVVASIVS